MTATTTKTSTRVTVENGWAVRNLTDGSQVRARLIHDPHHPEPERGADMWNEGVLLVRGRDGYGGMILDDHDGLREVLNRTDWADTATLVYPNERSRHDTTGEAKCDHETFVRRYLRAFHDVQHVSLRHHSGHSQSDWADVWVIVEGVEEGASPDNLADATWSEWDAWAKGDVYTVESQTRTLTDAMCSDPSDPDDGWEDADTYWGYIGDDAARSGLAEALGVTEADVPAPHEVTA